MIEVKSMMFLRAWLFLATGGALLQEYGWCLKLLHLNLSMPCFIWAAD